MDESHKCPITDLIHELDTAFKSLIAAYYATTKGDVDKTRQKIVIGMAFTVSAKETLERIHDEPPEPTIDDGRHGNVIPINSGKGDGSAT